MSLDNIQLSPDIIQSLYGKSLYDLKTDKAAAEVSEQTGLISFLGSNQKKIALLVKSEDAMYLPDEELNFLLGILTACKLSMADIALINISQNRGTLYTDIKNQLDAEKVFLFGVDTGTLELPLQFPLYQVQPFNDQLYLTAASLNRMQKNKEEKMKLWNCLKKIFSL